MEMMFDVPVEAITKEGPGGLKNMSSMSRKVAMAPKKPRVEDLASAAAASRRDKPSPPKHVPVRRRSDEDLAERPTAQKQEVEHAVVEQTTTQEEPPPLEKPISPPPEEKKKEAHHEPEEEEEDQGRRRREEDPPKEEFYDAAEVEPAPEVRAVGVAVIAVVVYLCRKIHPVLAFLAAVVGGILLVLAQSAPPETRDKWLQRLEDLADLTTEHLGDVDFRAKAETVINFLNTRVPKPAKQIAGAVLLWRCLGLLLGQRTLGAYFRGVAALLGALVGAFAYLPLYAPQRRGVALEKI